MEIAPENYSSHAPRNDSPPRNDSVFHSKRHSADECVWQSGGIPAGFSLTAGVITFNARGTREEATSDFSLSDGSTTYSFRVHATTGLVEVL